MQAKQNTRCTVKLDFLVKNTCFGVNAKYIHEFLSLKHNEDTEIICQLRMEH